jgi:hypothetical protein
MGQRGVGHFAHGRRLPLRAAVEQSRLEQVRRHAGVPLRDFTGDRLFPLQSECRRRSEGVGTQVGGTRMLDGDGFLNLSP